MNAPISFQCPPRPRLASARLVWALALSAGWLALAGCASNSDLKKVTEANKIQEQRLRALEQDTQATISGQGNRMKTIEAQLKALNGRIGLIARENQKIGKEQAQLRGDQERAISGQRKMTRNVEREAAKITRFRLEAKNDLDKIHTRLGLLEKMLKSPIASLPDKTPADKSFRQAHFLLINGELDLAADRFGAFGKAHPKDGRGIEALYRRGQALFLLRKYDHAMIPFFEVVEKSPTHRLAAPSRWMLARSLEETGDLKLAREFYAQLITGKSAYANDAIRRVAFINKLFPGSRKKGAPKAGRK